MVVTELLTVDPSMAWIRSGAGPNSTLMTAGFGGRGLATIDIWTMWAIQFGYVVKLPAERTESGVGQA